MNMRRIIAAAIVKENKVLIAKRKYGTLAGYWEFPGGKVEDDETDKECLEETIFHQIDFTCTVSSVHRTDLGYTYADGCRPQGHRHAPDGNGGQEGVPHRRRDPSAGRCT